MMLIRKQSGDTIVEVLIAMAVASLVLGSAYAVTNRTLANARQAQEHSEALRIAQGQIERLDKAYANSGPSDYLKTNTAACLKNNSATGAVEVVLASSSDCLINPDIGYQVSINRGASAEIFTVTVTWPSVTGNGNDTVSQSYRILQS